MMRKFLSAAMLAALFSLAPSVWAEEAPPPADAPAAEATPAAEPAPVAAPAPAKKKAKKEEVAKADEAAPAVETPAAAPAEAAPVAEAAPAEAAAATEAPAEAAPAATAPTYNEGNITWMLVSTAFVLLMSVPGLALFYGGMARSKNMLSTTMQIFTIFCVIAVLWVVYGYSVAFSGSAPFFGTLDKMMLNGVVLDPTGAFFVPTATFSRGVYIPELMFAFFQLTFACITVGLIAGGYAERMKFKAVLIFSVIWFTFSYLPMAHMVWWWAGPDSYTGKTPEEAAEITATAGYLWQMGALDFAGGTVVHINAGIAGLVAAIFVGKRSGYGKLAMPPHNLILTSIGAALLWFGWFGFNAGSNLEANGYAVLAFGNTLFATAVAAVSWLGIEWIFKGKPSLLGLVSGAVAGLVGITPAAGFVGIQGALVIGIACGILCFFAVSYLKKILGYDDALDAFGVHAVGGIIGAILTGVYVNPELGGMGYAMDWTPADAVKFGYDSSQILIQCKAVAIAAIWSAVVAAVTLTVLKFTIGLRVTEEAESEGLDVAEHGEKAYNP